MLEIYLEDLDNANAVDISESRTRGRNMNTITRNYQDPYDLSEEQFIKKFRLSKESVDMLVDELTPYMPEKRRIDALDVETKVLVALHFYASGSYQTAVGDTKNLAVAQSSVCKALQEVTTALNKKEVFEKFVQFPMTSTERNRLKNEFKDTFGIPALGCIDGTHVKIVPPVEHEERFLNRKSYHSLNVMVIADAKLQILCVDPSHPGSAHDSVIWNYHPLNSYMTALDEEVFLLGDKGYPLRETLLIPYDNVQPNTPEDYFNNYHVPARSSVERCFGVLKGRFRCLLAARTLHYEPRKAGKIVNACAVLHNIACKYNHDFEPLTPAEWAEEQSLTRGASFRSLARDARTPLQRGRAVRDALASRMWGLRGLGEQL